MYLTDYDTFVRQAVPPHWRDTWKHHLIAVLCVPLKTLLEDLSEYEKNTRLKINENSQVMSLETKLNERNEFVRREITVTDGDENGQIILRIPNIPSAVSKSLRYLNALKAAGKKLQTELYEL